MKKQTKNYLPPSVKVVRFMVEHGFDGTLKTDQGDPESDTGLYEVKAANNNEGSDWTTFQ